MRTSLSLLAMALGACPGQHLLENPEDPSAFGQWPVSSRVLAKPLTKRLLKTEVFFPAKPGSQKNATPYAYFMDEHLPPNQATKVPKCNATLKPDKGVCCQPTQYFDHVWEGLPIDVDHGPYPVIVFIHGTAGFRQYFLHICELWASRGFVVIAADYPGITMEDELKKLELQPVQKTDQAGDTELLIQEFVSMQDEQLQWLKGHIDMSLLGITGHSAGGFATGTLSSKLGKVLVPMAGGGTRDRATAYSTLVIGGEDDTVVGGNQEAGYKSSPSPKRHLGVQKAGHETYSDLCWLASVQGGITGVGRSCKVIGSDVFEPLADQGCRFALGPKANKMNLPETVWPLVRFATAAVFEETLMCDGRMTNQLKSLTARFNDTVVSAWQEDVPAN